MLAPTLIRFSVFVLLAGVSGCSAPTFNDATFAQCDGATRSVLEDRGNCGSCGVTCAEADYCQLGECVASRDWATFEVSAPPHPLREEGSTLVNDATGLVWAAEPSPPLDREGADTFCRQLSSDELQFRVPTMIQMSTLFDFGSAKPIAEGEALLGPDEDFFQVRSVGPTLVGAGNDAIDFSAKGRGGGHEARVRCVALDPDAKPMSVHYEDLGESFYDTQTHLYWAYEPSSSSPGGTANIQGSGSADLADATAYCERLSLGDHTDWRVPTALELLSLFWVNASDTSNLAPTAAHKHRVGRPFRLERNHRLRVERVLESGIRRQQLPDRLARREPR